MTSGNVVTANEVEVDVENHQELVLAADAEIAAKGQEARVIAPEPVGHDSVVILDFGSQYTQLIARRIRESGVYCEIFSFDTPRDQITHLKPKAFVLSGGPASAYEPGAPSLPPYILESGLPVLGICYGMQLITLAFGGRVEPSTHREFGPARIKPSGASHLFEGLGSDLPVWMSHGDRVTAMPEGFEVFAESANAPYAAFGRGSIIALQFHPEVVHTPQGKQILENFLFRIAGLNPTWSAASFVDDALAQIRTSVGGGHVLCGLSGGVDSAVAALLVHRAIGERLICVFVNNGLLREGEAEAVEEVFGRNMHMNLVVADASDRFLAALDGITEPEEKRKRIGALFVRIFEEEAARLGTFDFLAQGTVYPDVIESATPERPSAARIKTHHNVGGLPADLKFKLVEPLRYLFKDEVRRVGLELGLPEEIVWRHPFPGPGLAVRLLGPVSAERLETLRRADAIVREELDLAGLHRQVWQAFAVLLPVQSVGVMGDNRTYADAIAIRIVTSLDGMTADWAKIPYETLGIMSNRIVNEVPHVNRVVYDITSKPPATIEWE